MRYRIGLDIGIGSVGWAVISGEYGNSRIEDFGTRLFDSGELNDSRKSTERRGFRGSRRLVRRRSFRKVLLKNHLTKIGLIDGKISDDCYKIKDEDVFTLKVRGLDERLSPAEIYKCLIHTCNHRGYRDFYENDDSDDPNSEEGVNKAAVKKFDELFFASGKRTVSEYLLSDYKNGDFVKFRNRAPQSGEHLLIHRRLLKSEVELILAKQREYYGCLTGLSVENTVKIIFAQRCFEDGPGDRDDNFRRYKGFLAKVGTCPFYKDEKRGFRSTAIADIYAAVNHLSQYCYIHTETGEIRLDPNAAAEIVKNILETASFNATKVDGILKKHGITRRKNKELDKNFASCLKFLPAAKKVIESAGESWLDFIRDEHTDLEKSRLHQIGTVLSEYQTPSVRREKLNALSFMTEELTKAFECKKSVGTASVSYKYMLASIEAFKNGETYGNFQADFIKNKAVEEPVPKTLKLKPGYFSDDEIKDNPVVFRSVNETRKIINAIIDIYGSPEAIVVEVATDLTRSFIERKKIASNQNKNEKENANSKKAIAELLKIPVEDVTHVMLDKYKLYNQQEGKCLYSGKDLDLTQVLTDRICEIDHIVPYSLLLDNTLNNKALVLSGENQAKRQRTPLMYMDNAKSKAFTERVNALFKSEKISKKKYDYLMLESIYTEEARKILEAWKSRNINDTRYITKYIISVLEKHLEFAGNPDKKHVFGVKGQFTSKFRRIWLNDSKWGEEDKDRSTSLNHAADAVIVANLTPAYIEIASDNIKLNQIFKHVNKNRHAPEYAEYLEMCKRKMKKYYGFGEEYTESLLYNTERIPAFLPDICREVEIRFEDEDTEKFSENVRQFYGDLSSFKVAPHMPVSSIKPERKFRGGIADSNPIKLTEIDGKLYKVSRKDVTTLAPKHLELLITDDKSLISTLTRILEGKPESYTVEKYMKENELSEFVTDCGQPVRKVSCREKSTTSNYYKKQIDKSNYTILGKLSYYCIELYRNSDGELKTFGIRYVDIVRKNKKLCLRESALPADYKEHVMYLFKNDFIRVYNKKGVLKCEGYYQSVYNINENRFVVRKINQVKNVSPTINRNDTVKKFDVSVLGIIGGEIKCSEPLSLISEKK